MIPLHGVFLHGVSLSVPLSVPLRVPLSVPLCVPLSVLLSGAAGVWSPAALALGHPRSADVRGTLQGAVDGAFIGDSQ